MDWMEQFQLNLNKGAEQKTEKEEIETEEEEMVNDNINHEEPSEEIEKEEEEELIPTAPPEELEDEDEASFAPFVSELVDKGVLFIDDQKEYEDSEEGLAEIINDTVSKKVTEYIDNLPEEAKGILEYIQNGGNVKDYVQASQSVDFSEIDMEDEDNHKFLVEDYLKLQGLDADEIKEKIETYEDAGILEKEAKSAQKKLIKYQEEQQVKLVEEQRKQAELQRQFELEEEQKFKSMILDKEDLGGFKLNKVEREKFYDYLTKPTKAGKTQYQLEDTVEERLKMAYYKFKGFNFTDIERKATTKATIQLKKSIDKVTDKNLKSGGRITDNRGDERPQTTKLHIPNMWGKSSSED